MFQGLLEQILNENTVSTDSVTQVMDDHKKVIVKYTPVTKGREHATGARLIGVFAYGQTKSSNDCIRVYEYAGDTASFVPGWKLLRLDQIKSWEPTEQTFNEPPDDLFNPNGDDTMSVVFKVTKFGEEPDEQENSGIYLTDTEKELKKKGMKLKNQLDNPIYISDLKNNMATQQNDSNEKPSVGQSEKTGDNVDISYKDEVDNMFAPLKKQIANAKKIELNGNNPTEEEPKVRTEPENVPEYKKEVSDMFAPLKDKIANAEKIDLSKIKDPKKKKIEQEKNGLNEIIESGRKVTLFELRHIVSKHI